MPYNGSGTFVRIYSWVVDAANSINISSSRTDAEMNGFAAGLTNCITRDGQSPPSADIPWGAKRITNLGAATAGTDALNRDTADARYILTSSTSVSLAGTLTAAGAVTGLSYQFGTDADLLYQSGTNIATLRVGTGAAQAFMGFYASSSGIMLSSGTNTIFGVNGVEYVRLTGSGNFGIQCTPTVPLDVNGAANLRSTLAVAGASTVAALTASGLITGNGGFSGTTLTLSGTASLNGGGTSTTASVGDNTTKIATTAYVMAAKAPSVQSVTSAATVTPTFSNDLVDITAQAVGLTLAAPTGTAVNGWGLVVRIKDNGVPQTLTYNAIYVGIGVTKPTSTVAGKVLNLGMIYNANLSRWEIISVAQE